MIEALSPELGSARCSSEILVTALSGQPFRQRRSLGVQDFWCRPPVDHQVDGVDIAIIFILQAVEGSLFLWSLDKLMSSYFVVCDTSEIQSIAQTSLRLAAGEQAHLERSENVDSVLYV